MKKSILFIGAIAVAGFVGLTAFGGQTKAQQDAEIASAIQNKVDGYHTELQAGCEEKIAVEAKTQFDTWAAAEAAMPPSKLAGGKKAKKPTSKGGKVDPLPNPTPPAPTDPAKSRGGAVKEGGTEVKERGGAVKEGETKDVKKRGGAVKEGGGN